MYNLSAERLPLWFISTKLFAPFPVWFEFWRKLICPRDWMSSATMAANHVSQWRISFHAKLLHTHRWGTTIPSHPPECACMCGSIFSNTHIHTQTEQSVCNAMCQDGIMLSIQSDGLIYFAQSSPEGMCLYPALEGGHVLTSLCARVSALCSISAQPPSA